MNPLGRFALLLLAVSLGAIMLEVLAYRFIFRRAYGWRSSLATLGVMVGRSFTRRLPLVLTLPGAA